MAITHNLGFPRIGPKRELKFALEDYWQGKTSAQGLQQVAAELRQLHWRWQSNLDYLPVGDFSFYDHVLDMSFMLGHVTERVTNLGGQPLEQYFRAARGRAPGDQNPEGVAPGEMTKWFDTNYHYIVPELNSNSAFSLQVDSILNQIEEAKKIAKPIKPVLIGPLSYLWLCKVTDGSSKLDHLNRLLTVYLQLLEIFADHGVEWLQIDEPILVTELDEQWRKSFEPVYTTLSRVNVNLMLTSYFGGLAENLPLACKLPTAGIHLDAINGREEIVKLLGHCSEQKVVSLGVVNGRNIWKTDLNSTLDWLQPIAEQLGDRLWIAPSCSLLHVPVDLNLEEKLDPEIKSWLAFAIQKLEEISLLGRALNQGRDSVQHELQRNKAAIESRRNSSRVNNPDVKARVSAISQSMGCRKSAYGTRSEKQRQAFALPSYPTTTIGSFPQTREIRKVRQDYKRANISQSEYVEKIQQEIAHAIQEQESLQLDVLVHGEAERNDMVEYFGEQLDGFAFTQNAWVQSYGSRCVKPPILFGDISRPQVMTVEWIKYAQSLTEKPVKGMLTGPVTILNWSFVRDDQARSVTCNQLALAIRDEVLDLERAGVRIIQIDEAALREGLPLRRSQWQNYLRWAIESFRISANGVEDETQIHTHMCYSEFNDIIESIARMDADVITIETSRSQMKLLSAFDDFNYPNEIGPGVYDIHTPNIPSVEEITTLLRRAASKIPRERLWVNPDCGLKTRAWQEVKVALNNMVHAARELREEKVT